MNDLPNGWKLVTLKELGLLINGDRGKNYPSKNVFTEAGVPFINAGHLVDGLIDFSQMNYIPEGRFNLLCGGKVQTNDLLYCIRGSLGKIAIVKSIENGAIASSLVIIRAFESCNHKYLYYSLVSPFGQDEISKHDNGSAQPNLSAANLGKYLIPVAPLNEQRRIVAKLDRLFAHSRRTREELEHIPKLIKRYKQAVLAAACRGDLTEDWRIKQKLEESWESTTLAEVIVDKPKNGYSAKPVQYETPFRVLTLTATTSGKFNPEHYKYFEETADIGENFWLQPNDILIQRGNTIEYVGVAAIYDGLPNQFIFPDLMIRVRAKPIVLNQFLHMVLSCEKSRQYLRDRATGTAGSMPKINQPTLISLPIELPTIEEQKEIVRRVEKMFKSIESIEEQYQQARQLCDRLEQATLAKAFRGELVPQDPNDEPASVLLERICAEKQQPVVSTGKKSRRKTA